MRRRVKAAETVVTYHISSVSRRYNIHPQTLRLYEREGLLKPSRSKGNTRLYTEQDVRRLELILSLVRELGVNLAGVEVILNMRDKMEQMEAGVNELLEYVRKELFSTEAARRENRSRSLVPLPQSKIMKIG